MGMNALVFNVLKEIGINPARFSLQWASAAEAPRFVKLITEFTGKIKELGPLGESEGIGPEELQAKLEKGLSAVSSRKVRMVYGNTAKAIRKEGIFTLEYINGVIEEKLSKAIAGALTAEAEEEGDEPATAKKAGKDKPAPAAKKEKAKEKETPKKPEPKEKAVAPKKKVAQKPAAKKKTATKKKK
jgi:outer membrane biosynthesis protein TonB